MPTKRLSVGPKRARQAATLGCCIGIIGGGATLAVVEERPARQRAIVLRIRPEQTRAFHPDAYHLFTTTEGDVVIEASHVDGVRNGIYGLLTDHLDCHWFMPFVLGEAIVRGLPEKDARFRDRVQNQRDGFALGRGAFNERKYRVKPGALTPENREMVEEYAAWLAATRKKYDEVRDDWPTLLPKYYFNDLDGFVARAREEFK